MSQIIYNNNISLRAKQIMEINSSAVQTSFSIKFKQVLHFTLNIAPRQDLSRQSCQKLTGSLLENYLYRQICYFKVFRIDCDIPPVTKQETVKSHCTANVRKSKGV